MPGFFAYGGNGTEPSFLDKVYPWSVPANNLRSYPS